MCCPTFRAVAVTLTSVFDLRASHPTATAHTLNVRTLPESTGVGARRARAGARAGAGTRAASSRSEEHTSELQSRLHLVCRLLLEKKKKNQRHLKTVLRAPRTNRTRC